jgi:vancomycin resistance protein YoaR
MNNGRAAIFEPPKNGIELQIAGSVDRMRQAVEMDRASVDLEVVTKAPDITTTADIERLGIRELIGVGESNFAGSPRNRIHNIRVGTSRFHGLLIAPGEEFAFNKNLGPVTGAAGYLPELVILHDSTVPQFGGGLCQVSTTAFRAAVYSGMEVTERHPHAYPVSYYGTPGFDSTIYPNRQWRDGTDLKFINNTNHHVLIQARVEGTKNIFEFWGTSDGREVVVEGPYPYDRRSDGSAKATLRQKVYQEGELVFENVFHSSYRSPALYPRVREADKEREEEDNKEEESSEKVEPPPETQEPVTPPEEPVPTSEEHETGE